MTHDEAAKVLEAIEHALRMGFAPADILDENSPIRDGIRTALSAKPEAVAPVDFCRALNDVAQKAMDYARNTDFGGEDNERLAALWTSKDEAIRLYAIAHTAPPPAQSGETCEWSQSDDPDFCWWDTSCGEAWIFTDSGPEENGCKFCPYCGRALLARREAKS